MRWTEEQLQEYLAKKNKNLKSSTMPIDATLAKKSKYNNQKTIVDGIEFDSKKEAEYYCQLKLLKKAGEIRDIGLQQKFMLQPGFEKNGVKYQPITYIADFVITNNDGTTEVVDVKGVETQVFKIKQKLFEYMYSDLNLKVVK